MAGPKTRGGVVRKRFGKTGRPVEVSGRLRAMELKGMGRLEEDGGWTPNKAPKQKVYKKIWPGRGVA